MFRLNEALRILMTLLHLITSLGLSVESLEVDGFRQEIYTIRANPMDVQIRQSLSFDEMFGFENVSDMSGPGELGINGMFYNDIGKPAGLMIADGNLVKIQSINTPLFILYKDGRTELMIPELKAFILHEGISYPTYELNEGMTDTLLAVFTSYYGQHNRRNNNHRNFWIEDNKVVKTKVGEGSDLIPEEYTNPLNGDFMLAYRSLPYDLDIKVGDRLEYVVEANFEMDEVSQAFQTGGWLIEDGEIVVKDFEGYIGPTTSLQPRTAIGITGDGQIIVKVVDGRNPGVSHGVTGYQLAKIFFDEGCIQAAFLDGGASSTMVVDGSVLNRPSLGDEKPVAHGIFFRRHILK